MDVFSPFHFIVNITIISPMHGHHLETGGTLMGRLVLGRPVMVGFSGSSGVTEAPVYKRQVSGMGEGGNNRSFAFWGRILVLAALFLAFLEGFCTFFLMYFSSKSFRELKSAIKNQFFLYLGGLGAKLSF